MSIKALIRKLTGRGGALNRATTTREECRLSTIANAEKVSVWDMDRLFHVCAQRHHPWGAVSSAKGGYLVFEAPSNS